LLSGGPKSHHAKKSILLGPSRKRCVIRQPPLEDAISHSPLAGDLRIEDMDEKLVIELQEQSDGIWKEINRIDCTDLATALRSLPGNAWAGALAYDLVQWTQPIRLQYQPKEGTILAILWSIDNHIIHNREDNSIEVVGDWGDIDVHLEATIPNITPPIQNDSENSSMSDAEHASRVEEIQESIRDGELYQLNLGRSWFGDISEHPREVFLRLARENPAPFSAWVYSADLGLALASSSPEILLETNGKNAKTCPIKGTRPRGDSPAQEELLRRDLLNDTKERAEHRMLVDLERNDLSIVSIAGSVQQTRFDVETYANVQHLVSEVSGQLREDVDCFDSLQALFPGGSITGCPKTVTCASIDEIEKSPRGFWTGSIGWFDVKEKKSCWNILIRTMEAHFKDGKWKAEVMAGGGLVIGSVPELEVAEAKWKAEALRRACGWLPEHRAKLSSGELCIHPQEVNKQLIEDVRDDSQTVLFIDNLDSFSWNIIHLIEQLGCRVIHFDGRSSNVAQFDHCLNENSPTHIVIGPGPGRPEISPVSMEIAQRALQGKLPPVLGICLGHQAIGLAAGLDLIRSPLGAVHGESRNIHHQGNGLFQGLKSPVKITRYNSLVLDGEPAPRIIIDGRDDSGTLPMSLYSSEFPVFGIQSHPESIGSEFGAEIMCRFLSTQAHP